jgi:flagellar hook-basal body complex protein FliE
MGDITLESNLKAILGPSFQARSGEGAAKTEDGETFSQTLAESLGKVNDLQTDADTAIEGLVSGKSQNIHETMLAVGKADIAFRMTMQVRNKIVEAYQEVLRMQV